MEPDFTKLATLIGEENRAQILWAFVDGRYYTARELSLITNNSPQGISNHLKKLVENNLIRSEKIGRHKYFQFDRPEVGYAMEAFANLLPVPAYNKPVRDTITFARSCYDHLAGFAGVQLCDFLIKNELIIRNSYEFEITNNGYKWFSEKGIKIDKRMKGRKPAACCLDWTERRYHVGGSLGAAMLKFFINEHIFRRKEGERTLILSSSGEIKLWEMGIKLDV